MIRRLLLLPIAILAALGMAGSAQAAANLIVNGGFESPDAANGGYVQILGGTNFGGWTVTGADILLLDRNYTETGLVFNAAAGDQAADLTGAGNTSDEDGVQQTVVTTIGQLYRLSFEVGNAAPFGGNAWAYTLPSTLRLAINGATPLSFTNGTNNPSGDPGINFQTFTTSFVADTSQTTLRFFNAPGNDNYLGVDNVSLQAAVPEPATWALMIGGFGLAGGMLRRRRTALMAV